MLHFECSKQLSEIDFINNAKDFLIELLISYDKKTLTMNKITKKRFCFDYDGIKIKVGIAGWILNPGKDNKQPVIIVADESNFNKVFSKIQLEYGLRKKFSVVLINYMKDILCENLIRQLKYSYLFR